MIKVENLEKTYPDGTKAVKRINFEVADGEFCVLLGPSGCGKTTTMKMINRLIPITSGKVYINGKDTAEMNENQLRRDIGYAIQNIGLFPHMTVGQNIETVPQLKNWPKEKRHERAKELLKLMELDPEEFINKYPDELSGGQAQRIGVARCLGADPPILLMDEPFGAIDPITRSRLQDEFLKIQQGIKKTIIFVTHDIYEAIKMGDKIVLMNQGEIIQHDTPAGILYRPQTEFVEGFVGTDRAVKGLQLVRVKEVTGGSPSPVKATDSVDIARERMEEKGINWVAVADEGDKFLGWAESQHLENGKIVEEVMSTSDVVISPDVVLNEALSLMLTHGLLALPIIEKKSGKLQGIISFDDIRETLKEAST
ncbi:MAG: betaine/proline/choline family ABC transporter ATP-binding protein [Chloroflexota bacterium]